MARNPLCTVYIGNLDEKVSERVLYEILIQVGRVVDLHIPRDKETNRHKGYAFAEYETEEIADYAVRLFSGLVRLRNRTLKFAISGKDKPTQNSNTPVTPRPTALLPNPHFVHSRDTDVSQETAQSIINFRASNHSVNPLYSPSVQSQASTDGLLGRGFSNGSYEYTRRVFGSMLNDVSRQDARQSIAYPSY
ncbi:protein HSH49 [Ananas comosus]|uniref:Protein HSH49 n=1 Tax=Ananas comosus TaxID=4615 RepID=A0A6P5F718_ANACO|nr:protein HSH49 [Ananas comosus]